MFAKLKKTIEVQNNRPAQIKNQHTASVSVLNQNNNSSTSQAPVHHSAKSHILQKRSSQSKSPRTSTTEDFHEDHETSVRQQTLNVERATTHSYDVGDRLSGDSGHDLHLQTDNLIRALESPEFLEDFVSEAMEQQQQQVAALSEALPTTHSSDDVNRRLLEAENRIKTLEAELQEKSRRLEQHSKDGMKLSEHMEDVAFLKKKVSDYENDKRKLSVDFETKCRELSEVQQQLSTAKDELLKAKSNLKESRDELDAALKELKLMSLEKECLTSKIDGLTRANDELKEKLEASKKEKESQVERFLTSMSEMQTMAEVAEDDRRELEMRIHDMEKKFEEDLRLARVDSTNDMRKVLVEMEEQVKEKNKLLKKQEHKLSELRKVVQKELSGKQSNNNSSNNNNASEGGHQVLNDAEESFFNNSSDVDMAGCESVARINVTSMETSSSYSSHHVSSLDLTQDLNFKYLKHVILKFFLSREHEALQLIKVVSMLLRFNKDEEKMIKDTLQWRTSWFRSKPQLPEKGQSAIVVPALY